jgi:hypothetical protein
MRAVLLAVVFSSVMVVSAAAQTPPAQTTPEALTNVYQCATLQDGVQRLACYDQAVGRLREAEVQGNLIAVDRQQVATLERDSFGFSLPSLSTFVPRLGDGGESTEGLERVQLTVARIANRANGRHAFIMENGQIWTQAEAQNVANVRVGDTISVRRGAIGNYMLSPSRGGAAHRVRREE